jgi:type IV secretory pathway component VirB8
VVGWVSDVFFKANERNVRLLATHALEPDRTQAESRRVVLLTGAGLVTAVVVVLAIAVALLVALLTWLF